MTIQGKVFFGDAASVDASIEKATEALNDAHQKMTMLTDDVIPPIIDKKVALVCKEILAADLKVRIYKMATFSSQDMADSIRNMVSLYWPGGACY